jgi:hypothetical protein
VQVVSTPRLCVWRITAQAGFNTCLDALSADAQYHHSMITDLQLVAVRYQDTVALYVALGGGWWTEPARAAAPLGCERYVQTELARSWILGRQSEWRASHEQ